MRKSIASLLLLLPTLFILPVVAQGPGILYDNGLSCPSYCHDAWQINGGHIVTDSFFVNTSVRVTGFDFWTWEYPGDKVLRVQWSITSDPFGGTTYGSGATLASDRFEGINEYGYAIDKVTVTGLNVNLPLGTYWITLQNVVDVEHIPVYWDENSGEYCHSLDCPSSASENQVGTIPSETFDIRGVHRPEADDQTAAPTSGSNTILWGPMLIGLLGILIRCAA